MKNIFFLFICKLTNIIFCVIPLWNFEASTINLLSNENSHTYTIYTGSACASNNILLEKTITKSGNSITEKNYITVSGYKTETNWEGIESVYCISNQIYICPKGKFHMNKYEESNFYPYTPNGFSYNDDWDLQCYYQENEGYMFMGYLNKYNKFYAYKFNQNSWNGNTELYNGLYDFKWTYICNDNKEYPMVYISLKDGYFKLIGAKMTVKGSENYVSRNDVGSQKDIAQALTYSNAYFSNNRYDFYYITYNKEPPSFISGYCLVDNINYENLGNVQGIVTNTESPLDFYYDYNITEMKFIKNTKYVYYKIYNTIKEKYYYGIIDIILNKVIFNTDEKINSFKPYSSNSMLAITDNSAYKICALSDTNGCIDSCQSGNIIVDSQRKNFCGSGCSNFILKPNDICINECDLYIFHTKDNYTCGLCTDIDSDNQYKLLNNTGCLNNMPAGTYLYKEKYKLLKGTTIPTTILTTIPTTIVTTIPSTILTTIPKPPTTIPTTIPTKIQTTIQTTIPENTIITNIRETTIITEEVTNIEECDIYNGFFPVNYGNYTNKKEIKCLKKEENHSRVYFDEIDQEFKTCFETCKTCDKSGNKTYHNCITCEPGYQLKPEGYPQNNCVPKCPYYAFTAYEQYKCIENLPCPKEYKYLIEEKNKCIDDCKRDNRYKYLYNGRCYKECPNNLKNENYLCKENNDKFTLTENNIELNYTEFINSINDLVKVYSNEYSYTKNHVTQYKNEDYNTIIYKKKDSINELSLDYPEINFGKCYNKVQQENNITEDLIVVIINKMGDDNNPTTSYSFFDPKTGDKLNTEKCKNDTILVVENILSLLNENMTNYNAMLSLMKQGINIFNISDEFYTNLCYDYNYETNKDIALKDRLKLFYPNISLCDPGCTQTSVDLENFTANCECKFNDISNNNKDNKENAEFVLIENLIGDALDFLESSNIAVGKCTSKIKKSLKHSFGFYIALIFFIISVIFLIIFYAKDFKKINVYIYETTQKYLIFIHDQNNIISAPPLKKKKTHINTYKGNDQIKGIKNKRKKYTLKTKKNNIENLNILISINKTSNSKDNFIKNSLRLKTTANTKKLKFKNNYKMIPNNFTTQRYDAYFDDFFSESPDEMEFDDAIKLDKRQFCHYFSDNLKDNQIILNTFCSKDTFKPRSIKIIIFILNIFLYFVINALFINDEYISQVYNLKNEENFFSFIPRSINRFFYTTLVGIIIEFIVDFFFVEEKKLKKTYLREKDNAMILKSEVIALVKSIKKKYIAFSVFLVCIYAICLYYLIILYILKYNWNGLNQVF